MAREYYFGDIIIPGLYKNRATEARKIGGAFACCVYETVKEFGLRFDGHSEALREYLDFGPGKITDLFKAYIVYYRDGRPMGLTSFGNDGIDIFLEEGTRLIVDFKFDPLICGKTNDEIMSGIKVRAVERGLIRNNAKICTTNKQGFIQSESKWGPQWWMC